MPAKIASINLLEKDEFSESPIGRLVTWATTNGRYIIIATEIVVLLAFISRFSLDRKLTDLNEEIEQKSAIIQANTQFESDFKKLQSKLSQLNKIISVQKKPVETLDALKVLLPTGTYLTSYAIDNGLVKMDITLVTNEVFAVLMNNLQNTNLLKNISIENIRRVPQLGIIVQLSARFMEPTPAPKPASTDTNTNTSSNDANKI
jgi:Tfp pilus assembly protein PilN